MLLLAATALEKVKAVPPMFWVKAFGLLAGIMIAIILLQKVARVNKMILGVVAFVFLGILGFTWVYERNEPAFMTPLVDIIASSGFFPSKGAYESRPLNPEPSKPSQKTAPPKK